MSYDIVGPDEWERNVLFNDALNTFYLRLFACFPPGTAAATPWTGSTTAGRERERDIRVIYISLSDTKWSIYLFLYFSVLKLLFIQLGTITKTLIQLMMMRSKYKMRPQPYIKNKCHFTNEQSVYNPLPSTGPIRLFLITMHHTEWMNVYLLSHLVQ